MKRSKIDRAIEDLEAKKLAAEGRVREFEMAIQALRHAVTAIIVKQPRRATPIGRVTTKEGA